MFKKLRLANKFALNAESKTLPDMQMIKELSVMANSVYYKPDNINIPRAWTLYDYYTYHNKDDTEIEIAFYFKYDSDKDEQTAWCIAIRGTNSVINVPDDVRIMFRKVPSMTKKAIAFINDRIANIRERAEWEWTNLRSFESKPIYIVGHSLGAVVANMVHTDIDLSRDGRIKSIGFDNPGSQEIVKNYLNDKGASDRDAINYINAMAPYIHNIQSDVNMINTCNQQWGDVHRTIRYDLSYGAERQTTMIDRDYLGNFHYILSYSIDQHHIHNIMHSLISDNLFYHDDKDIYGFDKGYKEYLNPDRKDYWNKYINYCWITDCDNVHSKYKNMDMFREKVFADLNFMHNGLIKGGDDWTPSPFGEKIKGPGDWTPSPFGLTAKSKKCCIRIIKEEQCETPNLRSCTMDDVFGTQTSSATRIKPNFIFSLMDNIADYTGSMLDHAMNSFIKLVTNHAKEVVERCPSYFPKNEVISSVKYWSNSNLIFSNVNNTNILHIGAPPSQLTLGR